MPADALFCPVCGAEQVANGREYKGGKRKSGIIAVISVVIVCTVVATGAVCTHHHIRNKKSDQQNTVSEEITDAAGSLSKKNEDSRQSPTDVRSKIISQKTFRIYNTAGELLDSRLMEYDRNGKLEKEEVFESKSAGHEIRYYNEYGDPTKLTVFNEESPSDADEMYVYEFDDRGHPTTAEVHCLGYYRDWCTFSYDEDGNRVAMRRFRCNEWPWKDDDERKAKDYVAELKWKREYDLKGNIRREMLSDSMRSSEEFTWQYNEDGLLVSAICRDRITGDTTETFFDYEYDEEGNPVKVICTQDGIVQFHAIYENEFDINGELIRSVASTGSMVVFESEFEYQTVFLEQGKRKENDNSSVQYDETGEALPLVEIHYDSEGNMTRYYRYETEEIQELGNKYCQWSFRKEYNDKGLMVNAIFIPDGKGIQSYFFAPNGVEELYVEKRNEKQEIEECVDFYRNGEEYSFGQIVENGDVEKDEEYYAAGGRRIRLTEYDEKAHAIREVWKDINQYGEEIEDRVYTDFYYYDDDGNLTRIDKYYGDKMFGNGEEDCYTYVDGIVRDSYGYLYGNYVMLYENGETHNSFLRISDHGEKDIDIDRVEIKEDVDGHLSVKTVWRSGGFEKIEKREEEIIDKADSGYVRTVFDYDLDGLASYSIEYLDDNQLKLSEEVYDKNGILQEIIKYQYTEGDL